MLWVDRPSNTGRGNPEYLENVFFFSADQMRDKDQHGSIAAAYPPNFLIDTVTGVESASGDDPHPTNPGPTELKGPMSGGYGIINVVAGYQFSDTIALRLRFGNLFDKQYQVVDGFNTYGRTGQLSLDVGF